MGTLTIGGKFEFTCSVCGAYIDVDFNLYDEQRIEVTPCERCIDKAHDEGIEEGYDNGLEEGREKSDE